MKRLLLVLAMSLVIPASAQSRPGSGGPTTGTPHNNGGGTTGGTQAGAVSWRERGLYYIQGETRETLALKWTTGINLIYDDGIASRSERREAFRFLRALPRHHRVTYMMSWLRLRATIGRNTDAGVVAGIVAGWAVSDPAAAAGWLNSQTPRP